MQGTPNTLQNLKTIAQSLHIPTEPVSSRNCMSCFFKPLTTHNNNPSNEIASQLNMDHSTVKPGLSETGVTRVC